jgi:hypothetical protein
LRRGVGFAIVLAAAWGWGCAPRAGISLPLRKPQAVVLLAEYLRNYNAGPAAVRARGRLEVSGRGTADFGARAAERKGFRLDAFAGPFSSAALAMACEVGGECQVYVPSQKKAYLGKDEGWGEWFEALLRGRVPQFGSPVEAWAVGAERKVLVLSDGSAWREEVEFDSSSLLPVRVAVFRDGDLAAEILYEDHFDLDGHPFPARLVVRVPEPATEYQIEYLRVELDSDVLDSSFHLSLPPGIAVKIVKERAQWKETGIPFWLPIPEG